MTTNAGGDDLHARFLSILPRIELHARIYFRHVKCPDRKADLIQETRSLAWQWFVRLVGRGKDPALFAATFATLAARSAGCGRRVCGQEKARDVLSSLARRRHGFRVVSLPPSTTTSYERLNAIHGQQHLDAYEERLQENTVSPIPDQVAFRIDFPCWLFGWDDFNRRLILDLAMGERTKDMSDKYGASPGRISQKREQYHQSWQQFHGELDDPPEESRKAA